MADIPTREELDDTIAKLGLTDRFKRFEGFRLNLRAFIKEQVKVDGPDMMEVLLALMDAAVLASYSINLANRAKTRDQLSELIDGILGALDEDVQASPGALDTIKKVRAAMERGDGKGAERIIAEAQQTGLKI
jgi:hypothetical protein